ncbi:MAG: tetratricopeptide repeat protein [Gammaproteobacteria bacterium]
MANGIAKDLFERRVPHYLAAYLGGSWVMVEFFAFLEDRFLLSPYLTNFVLVMLALMLPSVAMFTYFHGRKGPDRWQPIEKVFIPLNLIIALAVMATMFASRDLGAMTTTVTVEDPEGNSVQRVVAKSEFRKSFVMFPFDVEDPALDPAIGFGVLNVLAVDLFQDIFVDARLPAYYRDKVREAGFEVGEVPRALKRRVSQELNAPMFVDGSIARPGSNYRLSLSLHDARLGRVIAEHSFEGQDLFALVDEASVQLRRDLDLPERVIEQTKDVPATDHSTDSVEALVALGRGIKALQEDDDYDVARQELSRALELDPTWAAAAVALFQVHVLSGNVQAGAQALQTAMDHLYRLPERIQFAVRAEWYAMQQDFPKAFAVYEMWAELFPQDLQAQLYVAQVRSFQGDREGALAALEIVLELDPTRIDIMESIGELNEALGRTEAARQAYLRYQEARPEDATSFALLAGLERRAGNHDEAAALYERASLLESGNIELITELAGLLTETGEFAGAEAELGRALASATSPEQRYTALRAWRTYYTFRGGYERALEYQQQADTEAAAFHAPIAQVQLKLLGLRTYVRAGRQEEALARLETLTSQLQPPMDAMKPIGRIAVYEAMERAEPLAQALEDGRRMLETTGLRLMEQDVIYGQGRLHEIRGDWRAAIETYEKELERYPTDSGIPAQIGRCYRALGEFGTAESYLLRTLRAAPYHGRSNYELALAYDAQGRRDEAIRRLRMALDTWAIADENYTYARLAREKLEELSGGR